MADERWLTRREELFGDDSIEQGDEESLDEFIGRMRELETGTDPHHNERHNLLEETISGLKQPIGGLHFRDTQDAAIWKIRHSIGITPTIRRIMSGRNGH